VGPYRRSYPDLFLTPTAFRWGFFCYVLRSGGRTVLVRKLSHAGTVIGGGHFGLRSVVVEDRRARWLAVSLSG
jgi:hypothetical protein